MVGLLNRFTSLIDLGEPYNLLSNTWVLGMASGLVKTSPLAAEQHVSEVS